MAKVKESTADPSTKFCLEFLVLTAVRSGEARGARWSEIDRQERSWTIPAERMKAVPEHSIPLSRRAVQVLQAASEFFGNDDLIFSASKRANSLSDMTLLGLLKTLEIPCVVHGFRSIFRTWAGGLRVADRDVCEAALAHQLDDQTERAYVGLSFLS